MKSKLLFASLIVPMTALAVPAAAHAAQPPVYDETSAGRQLPNVQQWREAIDRLSADPDPRLARNKRIVLEANYAMAVAIHYGGIKAVAERYMPADYIQHDPNVPQGRDGFIRWFEAGALEPIPERGKPAKPTTSLPPVAVFAEGDMVSAVMDIKIPDPFNPPAIYTYNLVVAYRVQGDKLVEHWGGSPKGAPYCRFGMCDPKK